MYSANFLFGAILAASIVMMAETSPQQLGDIITVPLNSTDSAVEAWGLNAPVEVGDVPNNPINLVITPANDTLRELVVPPPTDLSKRLSTSSDDPRCQLVREKYFVETDDPIVYDHSLCFGPQVVSIACIYFGRFGQSNYAAVSVECPDGYWCVQQNDGNVGHAWCAPISNLVVWRIDAGSEGHRLISYAGEGTLNSEVINQYWDGATGNHKNATNTTYVSTSPAHARSEFHDLDHVTSPQVPLLHNQGFDMYVTAGGIGTTVVISYLMGTR